MTLNEYQQQAMTTCMDTCRNIPYMLFNLQGEVGELSSKIAKAIRKKAISFDDSVTTVIDGSARTLRMQENFDGMGKEDRAEFMELIEAELGDVLWQLSGVCSVLGFSLDEVAQHNLAKLASRKQRGVIDGSGDNR